MSESIRTIHIQGEDVPAAILEGFRRVAPDRPTAVALVFAPDTRIGARLAEVIGEGAESIESLRELVLVHPGASVGFLASSLGLRLPRCRVHAERDEGAVGEQRPRSITPPLGSAQVLDLRDRPIVEAFEAAAAALRVRAGNRAVLLLDPQQNPPPGLTDVIVEQLSLCPRLREVVLVHPSAVLGFVASSAGLRLPRVALSAVRDAPE